MLHNPSPADEAEMRQEFRRLYREIGFAGCMQVLYEILKAGEWLSEIMLEEKGSANKPEPPCNGTCCS
jgi:hypothetical protein